MSEAVLTAQHITMETRNKITCLANSANFNKNKATSRYNLYDDFFSIRLNDGEKLGDMAGRLKDAMRRIKERRPVEAQYRTS